MQAQAAKETKAQGRRALAQAPAGENQGEEQRARQLVGDSSEGASRRDQPRRREVARQARVQAPEGENQGEEAASQERTVCTVQPRECG